MGQDILARVVKVAVVIVALTVTTTVVLIFAVVLVFAAILIAIENRKKKCYIFVSLHMTRKVDAMRVYDLH